MKKNMIILSILTLCFTTHNLSAKCYSFRKNTDVKVCINGDSNADRRKAQNICKQITGIDCGGVGGYTASCNKGTNLKCYNEESKEQKHISVD